MSVYARLARAKHRGISLVRKARFRGSRKGYPEALGRDPQSYNLQERHSSDFEVFRITPGATPHLDHTHAAQREFYEIIAGRRLARQDDATTGIKRPDEFIVTLTRSAVVFLPLAQAKGVTRQCIGRPQPRRDRIGHVPKPSSKLRRSSYRTRFTRTIDAPSMNILWPNISR